MRGRSYLLIIVIAFLVVVIGINSTREQGQPGAATVPPVPSVVVTATATATHIPTETPTRTPSYTPSITSTLEDATPTQEIWE